jgi:putative acetyltransferase
MIIIPIDPGRALNLIKELDDYQDSLYPAESNHLDSLSVLSQPNVVFLGAVEGEDIRAIGAVKILREYGEIKRVYVPEQYRGLGLAKMIMAELERILISRGIPMAKLETGIYQHAAIGLYRMLEYRECEHFGDYKPDPMSVFMSKTLSL